MLDARNVAIADQDREVRGLLGQHLERSGFRAIGVPDAEGLDRLLARQHVDLLVLDAALPGGDGFSICRRLSAEARLPIILLASKSDDMDRIIGLEIGADDYLAKPFNPRELVARAKNVLRRWDFAPRERLPRAGSRYRFGNWLLDTAARELVSPNDTRVRLTGAEYRMLLAFVSNANRVLTRQQLIRLTKGRCVDPFDRSVDVRISRLRRLLREDARRPQLIKTVYGDGYVLAAVVEVE